MIPGFMAAQCDKMEAHSETVLWNYNNAHRHLYKRINKYSGMWDVVNDKENSNK
jgi:hypothetical protein